jgi:hypothetical protein
MNQQLMKTMKIDAPFHLPNNIVLKCQATHYHKCLPP